jgi:type I restriction enzyme, S subunit
MTSGWCTKPLGELINVKHGYAFKGEFFAAEGDHIVLTPGNFPIGGGLKLRPGKDRYYTGPYPAEFDLAAGDLLVVMTDLTQNAPILGSPAFVPPQPKMLHNQRLGLVTVKPGVELDRRYLYYVLLSDTSRSQLRATATGTTVRHTAPERIYRVTVKLAPLPVQRRIGAFLGAIDSLIENSRQRIALLEEMMREIYREWFVRFRFPGREDVPLVESSVGPIPKEWQAVTLGEVIELKYGKALKADARNGGDVAAVGSSGIVGWHDQGLVAGPAIVLGRKGNVGSVTWIDGPCWPIDTTYFVESALPLRFLVEQLRRTEFLNTHAAVPGLSRDLAYSKPFLRPPDRLMVEFAQVSDVLASESSALQQQNQCLAGMRDLLLPKLVTGQVDISRMHLDALTEGAVA